MLLTILFATWLQGQYSKPQKEFRVINLLGAKVYEEPTFDSGILTELDLGETIQNDGYIETNEEFAVGVGFSLPGIWIKPKGLNGFVFSSDLTSKKAEIGTDESGRNYVDLLGELTSEESEQKKIKTANGEFLKHFQYKYYKNASYTYVAWDGCFDHTTEYEGLNINEVYHQMISDYIILMNGETIIIPQFLEKSGNKLKFATEGATEELTIELRNNGTIVVSSYDCT